MDNNYTPHFLDITLRLTPDAIAWLNNTTSGVSHFAIFKDLLISMATSDTTTNKRGITVELKPFEVEASTNGLSEKWNIGRKVMTRLLYEMEQLNLIKLKKSKLTSIATITAVKDFQCELAPQLFD